MKAPPINVPDHLEPSHYCTLAIQYYLMGWTRQSIKAGRLALDSKPVDLAGTPLGELSEEDYSRFRQMVEGLEAGVSIGEQVIGASKAISNFVHDSAQATSAIADEMIGSNKTLKLIKFGIEEGLRQLSKGLEEAISLSQALEQAQRVFQPPKPVPEGLTAQGYLDLAKQYLQHGLTEHARDALLKVREMEGEKLKGALAWTLLKTQLPKEPLPFLVEEGLSDARRKANRGQEDEAIEILGELIRRYPDIEIPYCVLAEHEFKNGRLEKATKLLLEASRLNPSYLSTWLLLAKVHAVGGSIMEAQRCLDIATELDSGDFSIPPLRQLISILSRL